MSQEFENLVFSLSPPAFAAAIYFAKKHSDSIRTVVLAIKPDQWGALMIEGTNATVEGPWEKGPAAFLAVDRFVAAHGLPLAAGAN